MGKIAEVQEVTLDQLIPYVNNAKIHSDDQVTKIASSIREFGFLSPVLIDRNFNIIAGHGRVMAAKKLNMETVPCVFIEGLSENQRKAYILADNRLAELASWDMNLVGLEIGELEYEGFDIDLVGFDNMDITGDDFGTDFSLPDGDKPDVYQMTFTLRKQQKDLIEEALKTVKEDIDETFGNTNQNGNALYEVVRQWDELRK